MKVMLTYEFKLYMSKRNDELHRMIDLAAEIWNHCIALHRRYYKLTGKHLSANKLKVHITKLKKSPRYVHWNQLGSQAIQDVVERIDRSYKAFFKHHKEKRKGRKSPPSFKKRSKYASFTLKQCGYSFGSDNSVVIMGKRYRYCKHRDIDGIVKTLTVKRKPLGEFYLYVVCEKDLPESTARTGNAVGMDFGLKGAFLTLDSGAKIQSPQWYKASMKELRAAHRNLSHKCRGSGNWHRAKKHLDRVYERIAHRRKDWFYNLSHELCEQYDLICIEDLNLGGMKRLWGRKVSDIAFAEFVGILEWVAIKEGTQVLKADRWFPSSKACNSCGTLNETLTLADRTWVCPCCGVFHDRDINAAKNIRQFCINALHAEA